MRLFFSLWFQKSSCTVRGLQVALITDAHACSVKHLPLVATVAVASMQYCSVSTEVLECSVMWDAFSQQRGPYHSEVRAQQPIRSQCQEQIAVFPPQEQPCYDYHSLPLPPRSTITGIADDCEMHISPSCTDQSHLTQPPRGTM